MLRTFQDSVVSLRLTSQFITVATLFLCCKSPCSWHLTNGVSVASDIYVPQKRKKKKKKTKQDIGIKVITRVLSNFKPDF